MFFVLFVFFGVAISLILVNYSNVSFRFSGTLVNHFSLLIRLRKRFLVPKRHTYSKYPFLNASGN